MTYIPLFNDAESQQVAALAGFDPRHPGLAQECFLSTQGSWSMPCGLPDESAFQAHFFLALGLFIWLQYLDQGLPVPASVADWYDRNTALMGGDVLFVEA